MTFSKYGIRPRHQAASRSGASDFMPTRASTGATTLPRASICSAVRGLTGRPDHPETCSLRTGPKTSSKDSSGVALRDHGSGPHDRDDPVGIHVEPEPPLRHELPLVGQERVQNRVDRRELLLQAL